MADGEDQTGIVELASETVAPVREELRRRLSGELDERDALAVETALLKAFISGMRQGITETAEKVVEQSGALSNYGGRSLNAAQLDEHLPELDPWAERHG